MNDSGNRICPACGCAADSQAAFCEFCGAELRAPAKTAVPPSGQTVDGAFAPVMPAPQFVPEPSAPQFVPAPQLGTEPFAPTEPQAPSEPPAPSEPQAPSEPPAPSEPQAFSEPFILPVSPTFPPSPAAPTYVPPFPPSPAAPAFTPTVPPSPAAPAFTPTYPPSPAAPNFVPNASTVGSRCLAVTTDSPDMPFDFEWDNAREFIEGVLCNFAFRLRLNAAVEELTIKADVGGETIACNPFTFLCAGDERNGTLPFIPKVAGALSVRVFAEVRYKRGCCELFEAIRPFEHQASPFRRFLSDSNQDVEIKIDGNSGLIRLDDLQLPRQAIIDLKDEINQALSHRNGWENVVLASNEVRREVVNLCTGERMLTVVSGANPVSFGRSSRRAAVQLLAETEDGQIDEYRSGFISNVHFTLLRCNAAVMLRDGGIEDDHGRKVWHKSRNGVSFNGRMTSSDQKLSLGRTAQVVLAPYVVPGGAVSVSLEARGHSAVVSGCDRVCELACVAIHRDDIPDRAALVVWGAADIDDFLGTRTGLHIGLIRGRLRLIRPDGSSKRLLHLVGTVLPGTDIFVQ